jgi:hypothetical protein
MEVQVVVENLVSQVEQVQQIKDLTEGQLDMVLVLLTMGQVEVVHLKQVKLRVLLLVQLETVEMDLL